jgi:hypothetical protein
MMNSLKHIACRINRLISNNHDDQSFNGMSYDTVKNQVFQASDESFWITGETLYLSGGLR